MKILFVLLLGVAIFSFVPQAQAPAVVSPPDPWLPYQHLLRHSPTLILYSLDPEKPSSKAPKVDFHGYEVLGQTSLPPGKGRNRLLSALQDGMNEAGDASLCFSPRHGLRAGQGTNSVELLICFQCHQIRLFSNETKVDFLTSPRPAAVFNAALKKAGVPMPQ